MKAAFVSIPELAIGNPARLTSLDLATGRMLGCESRPPLPRQDRRVALAATLEEILEPAVSSGRCVVSFSGGRESAFLLAVATRAARRRGYPDPVPATIRRRGQTGTHEAQERIVQHLRLRDWERIDVQDELEVLGPYARRTLTEVGVLFPSHLYVFRPLLDVAQRGWLLAGGVITDFYLYWRWARAVDVLAFRRRPRRRDLRDVGLAIRPRRVRAAALRSGPRIEAPPWLRDDARREVERLLRSQFDDIPVAFDSAVSQQRTHRCHEGTRRSLDALAASAGARFLTPFRDDRYIAALAAAGGRRGFGDRTTAVARAVSDLLPPELLRRSDGPGDRYVHVDESTRSFAERWSGTGLNLDAVDTDALRAVWSTGDIPPASAMLLQLAFAHDEAMARGMKKV